jgi:cell division septum initiation protein DivIVA
VTTPDIERLRARIAGLEQEIAERDGATEAAVVAAVNQAEARVDDLLAGWEIDPAALNGMLAARFSRILELRTDDLAAALTRVGELEAALAHRGVEMAYEFPAEVVQWDQIPEATRERLRARAREIEADLIRRGYRHVDNAAGKGFEAPPFEKWLWDLLGAIWPGNGPEFLDGEVMGDALYALSVLHESSAACREAIAVLGDDAVNIDRVAEALRVLRRGSGQPEPAPQADR